LDQTFELTKIQNQHVKF